MLVNSNLQFRIDKLKHKEGYLSPNSVPNSELLSQNNYRDIERPLKTENNEISFKGLSLYKPLKKVYNKEEFLDFSRKYLGNMGEDLFENITKTHSDRTKNLITVDGDNISIRKKTIPHLAMDGILYPFKILPADMLNGIVGALRKVPGFKTWASEKYESEFFKNIRQRSKIDSKVNSLVGLITYRDVKLEDAKNAYAKKIGKKVKDLTEAEIQKLREKVESNLDSSVFQSEMKMFDPKTGNYDTKHERALNRLVSGLPPAIFLANDAYNLSRMMDDDSKAANKERKIRFKQETSRILTSGYLTLITMGAFQKFINKSKLGIVILTGTTVLLTEMFSRLSNGKYITRLTPEQAREINKKENAPEANIKPVEQKPEKDPVSSTGAPTAQPKEQQKPLLSFDTLMKASAVVLAAGYGIKGFKNIPKIQEAVLKYFEKMKTSNPEKYEKLKIEKAFQNVIENYKKSNPLQRLDGTAIDREKPLLTDKEVSLKNAVKIFEQKVLYRPFTELYKKLTTEKYIVDADKFKSVVEVLRKNGFGELAAQYEKIGNDKIKIEDGKKILDLGMRDKKIKPAVNFVIAPFKFMWNTITLPYWMIDEKIMSVFRKAKPKSASKDIDSLAKSFEKISKKAQDFTNKKISEKEFKDYVQINLLKAFNVDSLSSVSNAELSNLAKTAASIATIWFLMTDNYNMVMLKSNGNDKDGANTKFKERFVQEGSRLFYQTLLIDLFNSTFMKSYNGSLLGMSWVTLADTTLGEMLTRSSVGIPIKTHTRDELIDIETRQNNSTGFKKKYYNFMQRLTGKRSIKSYEIAQSNSAQIPQKPPVSLKEMDAIKRVMFENVDDLNQKDKI